MANLLCGYSIPSGKHIPDNFHTGHDRIAVVLCDSFFQHLLR